jgi:hypothetical protein
MEKDIMTFLIIILLLIVNNNYLKGEKANCKLNCVSQKVAHEINPTNDGILPYYPFFINI